MHFSFSQFLWRHLDRQRDIEGISKIKIQKRRSAVFLLWPICLKTGGSEKQKKVMVSGPFQQQRAKYRKPFRSWRKRDSEERLKWSFVSSSPSALRLRVTSETGEWITQQPLLLAGSDGQGERTKRVNEGKRQFRLPEDLRAPVWRAPVTQPAPAG